MTDELRMDFDVTVSESAYDKLIEIAEENERMDHFLRIYVKPQGFGIALDNKLQEDDEVSHVIISDGIILTVVTDRVSHDLVDGVEMDWQIVEGQEGFTLVNPNMEAPPVASCGSCTGEAGCC